MAQRAEQMNFMSWKRSIFVIDSYFKSQCTGCNILNEVCKRGTICQQKLYERGTFFVKNGI